METEKLDLTFASNVQLILPVVGDIFVQEDGSKWLVVGRTLMWNNRLIVHYEKIKDNGND